MTEEEKMYKGLIYDPYTKEMTERRIVVHELCMKYNSLKDTDTEERNAILKELMPNNKEGVYIQGPIQFDLGYNITMGKNSYANFNFTVLDENIVKIGDNVMIGPNCTLLTPIHPLDHIDRATGVEYSAPIEIGNNCWLASNVTVLPGVTIGEGSVIGAGSVVAKSIPAHSLAFGNPCKVIREITEKDKLINHPELYEQK